MIFQWFCFSVERSERDNQLQYTIPQHCGESTTGRQSEGVILQIWKKNTPHLLRTPLHTTVNTSSNPPSSTPAIQTSKDEVWQVFRKQKKKSTRPRRCHTSLSEIMCWPAGPHLHKDLQQITGTVRSPFMLQTLHPHPKEIQNYRTKWLQACGSNICGHEVI